MSDNKSNQTPPTIEELQKAREKQTAFMKEQIEHLKIREEYSGLKAKIAENAYVETMAKMKLAQLQAKPEEQTGEDPKPQE